MSYNTQEMSEFRVSSKIDRTAFRETSAGNPILSNFLCSSLIQQSMGLNYTLFSPASFDTDNRLQESLGILAHYGEQPFWLTTIKWHSDF